MSRYSTHEPKYIHIHLPPRFDVPLVLPNGTLHGSVKTGIDGWDDEQTGRIWQIDMGSIIFFYDCETGFRQVFNRGKMYFIRHVITLQLNDIQLCNLNLNSFICGYPCKICNKIHHFYIAGSAVSYERNCLESSYHLVNRLNTTDLSRKRAKIARQIIDYAKRIKVV